MAWTGKASTAGRSEEAIRTMTQIEQARQGTITPEMEYVARREGLSPS